MREEWERSHDNTHAVAEGLEKTGGLITNAAAIMVAVFAAFALARVVVVKAMGVSMALAVLIDATLVRVLLVARGQQAVTLRLLLTSPVGRLRLLAAKYLAGLVYTAFVVGFLALMSWGMGRLVFGTGDLIVFYQTINIVPEAELPWRFAAAFAYGGLSMGVVASLAFFCSTLANHAMGPIITTVAILIGCTVISTIEVGIFRTVQPLLFTTYLSKWQMFFAFDIPVQEIWLSIGILVGHMAVLFGGAAVVFFRKDFTT